jgi:hypothetical protein
LWISEIGDSQIWKPVAGKKGEVERCDREKLGTFEEREVEINFFLSNEG